MQPSPKQVAAAKALIFALALAPLAKLVAGIVYFPEWLGANPAEFITRSTGDWTLRFLLITLAVTPLRKLSGWHWLVRFRRMLGLFAFFYGVVHFSSFIAFDHVFDVSEILKDIVKRPFITVGFIALVLMLPLALTSTDAMVKRLGGRRWLALHRLVYVIAPLGVLHFWWMVKRDITEPAIYAAILAVLLGYRVMARRSQPLSRSTAATMPIMASRTVAASAVLNKDSDT
jgi:sulfoxide reductase heme-binding subunit YedZ